MKIQYSLIISLLLFFAMELEAQGLVMLNTLDYPFMNDIANFIRETDQDVLFPQYKKPKYEAEYHFDIASEKNSPVGYKSFDNNGTYSICVSLSTGSEPYFFDINGIRFRTHDTLMPYFKSCNRNKVPGNIMINDKAWFYYFWFFEVKDGKVVDAVYFYEPVDDGFDKYDVYDLIHKEYIPYKVWNARIHPVK